MTGLLIQLAYRCYWKNSSNKIFGSLGLRVRNYKKFAIKPQELWLNLCVYKVAAISAEPEDLSYSEGLPLWLQRPWSSNSELSYLCPLPQVLSLPEGCRYTTVKPVSTGGILMLKNHRPDEEEKMVAIVEGKTDELRWRATHYPG